jgi:hypothetical protein
MKKQNRILSQNQLRMRARKQRAIGYDFSPLIGDPFEGFGSEGEIVRGGNFGAWEDDVIAMYPNAKSVSDLPAGWIPYSAEQISKLDTVLKFRTMSALIAEAKNFVDQETGDFKSTSGLFGPTTLAFFNQMNPPLGAEIQRQMALKKQQLLTAQALSFVNDDGSFRPGGFVSSLESIRVGVFGPNSANPTLYNEIVKQMVLKPQANLVASAKSMLSPTGEILQGIFPFSWIQEKNPKLAAEVLKQQALKKQELLAENARNYMAQSNPLVPIDRLRTTNPALANEIDRQIALKAGTLNSAYQNRLIAHGFSPFASDLPTDADMDRMDLAADQSTDMARVAALAPNLTAGDVRAFRFVMGAAGQEPIYDDQIEANACRVWKNEQEEIARLREVAWVAELKDRIEHPERHVFKSKGFFAVLGRAFTSVILPVVAIAAPFIGIPALLSSVPVIGGAVSSVAAAASAIPAVSSVIDVVSTVKDAIPTDTIRNVQAAVNAGASVINAAAPSPAPTTSSVLPAAPVVTPKPEYAVAAKVAEAVKPKPRFEHPMLAYGLIPRRA